MYKVRKKNKGSDRCYEYLHLVETIRTEGGPRQRLLLNLGNLDISLGQYKNLANCIEGILSGQQSLWSFDPTIEKYAQNAAKLLIEKRSQKKKRD